MYGRRVHACACVCVAAFAAGGALSDYVCLASCPVLCCAAQPVGATVGARGNTAKARFNIPQNPMPGREHLHPWTPYALLLIMRVGIISQVPGGGLCTPHPTRKMRRHTRCYQQGWMTQRLMFIPLVGLLSREPPVHAVECALRVVCLAWWPGSRYMQHAGEMTCLVICFLSDTTKSGHTFSTFLHCL